MITDSFHGTCMAILFQKPFIAIGNPGRGSSRFESLLGDLGLLGRYVEKADEILKRQNCSKPSIIGKSTGSWMRKERPPGQWLKDALDGKRPESEALVAGESEGLDSGGEGLLFAGWGEADGEKGFEANFKENKLGKSEQQEAEEENFSEAFSNDSRLQ